MNKNIKKNNLKLYFWIAVVAYLTLFVLTFPAVGILPVSALFVGVIFAIPMGILMAKAFSQ